MLHSMEPRFASGPPPSRWQRLKELVADTLELPVDQRRTALDAACAATPELHAEAMALLAAATDAADFLERPVLVPNAVAPLPAGTRCGPYRLESLLGEGGFSEVYRARQLEPIDRAVAVKVLKPGMDSRAVLARFALERQTLARLHHPGIAQILDAGATDAGRPFVAVELIEGPSLAQRLAAEPVPLAMRLGWFLQVCDAVVYAHQRGVIHRDLKPSNILISGEGDAARAVVIDFGIAKVIEESGAERTHTGQLLGTPAYCSPEQRRGDSDGVDVRSDVFALGVVLAEMVTGTRPAARAPWPKHSPRELGWIVALATAVERDQRYPGVAELAGDVRAFQTGSLLRAGPPTRRYRVATFVRKHRWGLAAAATVVIALVAGTTIATIGYWQAEAARVETAHALREADATSDYLQHLILATHPSQRGRDVKVVDLLAASDELLRQAADLPNVQTRLQHVVGLAYLGLGEFAAAEQHLREAATAREREHGPLDWRGIEMACDLAGALSRAGKIDETAALVESVSARAIAVAGERHPRARILIDLRAKLAFDRGRPGDAVAPLQQLLALDEADGVTNGVISTCGNLAQVLLGLDRKDEAAALSQRGLDLARQQYGSDHPISLSAARKRATVHRVKGEPKLVLELLGPLLEVAAERLGSGHPDHLGIVAEHAKALLMTGDGDRAVEQFHDLVEQQRRKLAPGHPQAIQTLIDYGEALEHKRDFTAAEAAYRDAANRLAAVRSPEEPNARNALLSALHAASAAGRDEAIAAEYADVLARWERAASKGDTALVLAKRKWLQHLQKLALALQERSPADAIAAWHEVQRIAEDLDDAATAAAAATALAKLVGR